MIDITMPALSPTMEEGTLARWLVAAGDAVAAGDILAEIETDKATMEFEAVDEGTVAELVVAEGTDGVKVGEVIARLAEEGEDAAPPGPAATAPTVNPANAGAQASGSASPHDRGRDGGGAGLAHETGGATEHRPPDVAQKMGYSDAPAASPAKQAAAAPTAPERLEGAAPPKPAGPTTKVTVREALRDAMAEEMRADDRVFVMGEEVAQYQGAYKVTQGLLEEFGPTRVIDTPITEYGFAGLGTGAAMGGLRPIVEFMTFNFALQAIDHIVNSAGKTHYMSGGQMRCPVVFRGPNGAASRVGAQHSQNFAPWYASVPGLIVIAPYDSADAKGLLKAAIRCEDPVVFLENELVYGRSFEVPDGHDALPIGRARVVREGADVTIVAYSIAVGLALDAADALAKDGIEADVIDLRTLRPLDTDTVLRSLAKTNRVVVAEEGWPTCSIASEIAVVCMERGFDDLDAPVTRVTNADVPMPYAANLEAEALIDAGRIAAACRAVCYR